MTSGKESRWGLVLDNTNNRSRWEDWGREGNKGHVCNVDLYM